jgi:hypothetical protein
VASLETIGLFGFGWTNLGPKYGNLWIAPTIFSCLIGIANVNFLLMSQSKILRATALMSFQYAIYQSSIDYMTASYGLYAASAIGGNDLARDFLAGIAALYSTPSKWRSRSSGLFSFLK